MDVEEFLARAAARPWCWGEHDCTLMPADWILERRGFDLAAGWRWTYSTGAACERRLRRAGGLEHVWSETLGGAGISDTLAPSRGDVGLVLRRCEDLAWRAVGALLSSTGWVSLTPDGLLRADAPLIAAWRI